MNGRLFGEARRSSFAILGLIVVTSLARADDPKTLSKAEIAKIGKAATALIQVDQTTFGSAFCIHPSGLFITNNHVLRGQATKINLVLNPGLGNQQVFDAKVVRRDQDMDLALIRIESKGEIPALTLGSVDRLQELTEVIVFGYPFGQRLATKTEQYPAISINTGTISSLRVQGGELHRIQLNGAVNPGNSGGPLLDTAGAVVGVVVGRIEGAIGAGIDLAIPANLLQRFVARPEIVFAAPKIPLAKQHEAFDFRAQVVSVVQPLAPLDLDLIFDSGRSGGERHHPMKFGDGAYHVTAVPFPESSAPVMLRAEIKFDDGGIKGIVEDREFRLGEQTHRLSDVRSLRFGPNPEVVLANSEKIAGGHAELGVLTVQVGGHPIPVDTAKVVEMTVDSPGQVGCVSCTIVAMKAGKEVGRLSVPIYVDGLARPSMDALRDEHFIMPPRSGAPVTYLRAKSEKGDYIGGGQSYSYNGDEIALQKTPRGVLITVDGWRIEIGAPNGEFLAVGEYLNAKRHPFSDNSPGIEFSGHGRGCNQIAGKFVVWELEVKGNQIVRLAIDFIQHCEQRNPPLYGMIRFNSSFH